MVKKPKEPALNEALMKELECTICGDHNCGEEMLCCRNGHNVCVDCLLILQRSRSDCPVCRCKHGWSRNLALERIVLAANLRIPCGTCDELCEPGDLKAHRNACIHRKIACPVDADCCQTLTRDTIAQHVRECHAKKTTVLGAGAMATFAIASPSIQDWSRLLIMEERVVRMYVTHVGINRFDVCAEEIGYSAAPLKIRVELVDIMESSNRSTIEATVPWSHRSTQDVLPCIGSFMTHEIVFEDESVEDICIMSPGPDPSDDVLVRLKRQLGGRVHKRSLVDRLQMDRRVLQQAQLLTFHVSLISA